MINKKTYFCYRRCTFPFRILDFDSCFASIQTGKSPCDLP